MENNNEEIKTPNSAAKVRVGLHTTLQKFGKLRNDGSLNDEGLSLTLSENKALYAVQKLLNKTSYKGNDGVRMIESTNSFNFIGSIPRITFTPSEYLEAYGLEKRLSPRGYMEYNRNERTLAFEALDKLSKKMFQIVYERHVFNKNKEAEVIRIETTKPLLSIYKGFFGLTKKENRMLDNGETNNDIDKKTVIGVEVCPMLVDQIDSYYMLISPSLYSDIKKVVGGGRYSRHIALFIEWLIAQAELQRRSKTTGKVLELSTEKLAIKLRMYDLVENYKWNRIRELLDECYETAKQLGYILEWKREEDKEIITLNSEIALSNKGGFSAQKKRVLCPIKVDSLSNKSGTQKRLPLQTLTN